MGDKKGLRECGYFTGTQRIDAMEVARQTVSRYHYVTVKWAEERPHENDHPIENAVDNLRFKCTCHFFSRNAVYCEHVLAICHYKGIIDINGEIRQLAKVCTAGRPKKQHFMMKTNPDNASSTVLRPASLIGQQLFSKDYGIGFVGSFEGNDLWKVEFPQTVVTPAIIVNMNAEDIFLGMGKCKNHNWAI